MKKRVLLLASLLTALAYAAPAEQNKKVEKMLSDGQYGTAYELLQSSYLSGQYDMQTLFLLGVSAKHLEKYDEAINYFQEILIVNSGAHRVRLELAICFYKTGQYDKAKKELLVVKASNPPQKVGENIEKFLQAMTKGKAKAFQVSAGFSYFYDSNVNAGPELDIVSFGDFRLVLNKDAKENKDYATSGSLRISSNISLSDSFAWQTMLSGYFTEYNHMASFDSEIVSGSTGPVMTSGKSTILIPLTGSQINVGNTDNYYIRTIGVVPQFSYELTPAMMINAKVGYQYNNYYNNFDKDSHLFSFNPGIRVFVNNAIFVETSVNLAKEKAGEEFNTNNTKGASLGAGYAFSKELTFFGNGIYSTKRYKEADTAVSDLRRLDAFKNLNLSASYLISSISTNIVGSFSYIDNESNIDLYTYDRRQVKLTCNLYF